MLLILLIIGIFILIMIGCIKGIVSCRLERSVPTENDRVVWVLEKSVWCYIDGGCGSNLGWKVAMVTYRLGC